MNTHTEHHRKLAETLKSLSFEREANMPMPPPQTSRWKVGGLGVAAAVALVIACGSLGLVKEARIELFGYAKQPTQEQAKPEEATRMSTDPPSLSPISQTSKPTALEITGSGYVVAPRATSVFAKYEGKITGIAVEVGERVKAGQILMVMEDASALLAVDQAKAARVSADLVLAAREIVLVQADASFRRAETLTQRNAAPRKELDDAEAVWKSALNNVEQGHQDVARADIAMRVAQERVDELTIRAPIDGTVTQVSAHLGDTVLARVDSVRESQGILTLADTTNMVIDADIAETNLSLLQAGLQGEAVLDGLPSRPFSIVLQRIAPIASAEKGTIGIRLFLINPPDGIRPNMAARIRIIASNVRNQIGEVSQ